MARHPGRSRPLLVLIAIVMVAVAATACGTSGRSMREPATGATAPPRRADVTTTTVAGFNTLIPSDLFTLTSSGFAPNEEIPPDYSCDGAGTSPPFTWANVPIGTVELVLLISDPDADGFVHWMVTGIDPTSTQIPVGVVPPEAVVLNSTTGAPTYVPLCPPPGPAHTYQFTLYALTSPSGLTAAADTRAAVAQVASNAASTAVLTGTYARGAT
jgi:Raf kinase inhibitor-like YbhB/YbcL family protein